jgi:hypothetical protein
MFKFIPLLLLLACNKAVLEKTLPDPADYKKFSIQQGDHNSTPLLMKMFYQNCYINGKFYFTEASKYNLGDEDQYDFNKLVGFKLDYNPVPNHSALIGWRYDTLMDCFQVAPYFNKNGLVLPLSSEIVDIEPYEVVNYQIKLQGKLATIRLYNEYFDIEKELELKKAGLFTRVHPWFGGNEFAPNDIELYLRIE